MSVIDDFEEIANYTHFWNWLPDWEVAKEVYAAFPESYSILTPFAYSYLEELIRTTTSEYGLPLFEEDGMPKRIKVGMSLLKLACEENENNLELVALLNKIKKHFTFFSDPIDDNGRNYIAHGHLHPRFWSKESFEELIHEIAEFSKFSRF